MRIARCRKKRMDFLSSGIFSDLAFLLLIFFLVVGTFMPSFGYGNSSVGTGSAAAEPMELHISDQGFLYNGHSISTFMMMHKVGECMLKDPETPVFLYAASDMPYQSVISAVDMLKKTGVRNFSLFCEPMP